MRLLLIALFVAGEALSSIPGKRSRWLHLRPRLLHLFLEVPRWKRVACLLNAGRQEISLPSPGWSMVLD